MSLLQMLFSRKDNEPVHLTELTNSLQDDDDLPRNMNAEPDPRVSGIRIGIVYEDAVGAKSKRVIRLKRVDGGVWHAWVTAYCELRKEERTFILERMLEIYDPASGEVLQSPSEYFAPILEENDAAAIEKDEKRRFGRAWGLIDALRHELQILVLVARADGRFARAEQELLIKYASERARDLNISVNDEQLVKVKYWMKNQDPSEPELRIALNSLKNNKDALDAIWQMAELVGEADKKYGPEERSAVELIRDTISAL